MVATSARAWSSAALPKVNVAGATKAVLACVSNMTTKPGGVLGGNCTTSDAPLPAGALGGGGGAGVDAESKAPATPAMRNTKPSESSTSVRPQAVLPLAPRPLARPPAEPLASRPWRRLRRLQAEGERREQRHGLQTGAALRHVSRAQPRLELRPVVHQPLPEHRRQPRAAPRARTFVAPEEGAQRHGSSAHPYLCACHVSLIAIKRAHVPTTRCTCAPLAPRAA